MQKIEEELELKIRERYNNFESATNMSCEQKIVSSSIEMKKAINIGDKQYLVFEFDKKDVIANFDPAKVTQIPHPGYANDLDLMLNNVKEVFEALYKAGFLTNGCTISFGGSGQSSLNIRVCV